ncbi:MAG: hypothetical protein KY475_05130 [Planctomycetes bacterium]|nr:hypothetical protein [Planctomycetota bacterium]
MKLMFAGLRWAAGVFICLSAAASRADETANLEFQARELLKRRCHACHGAEHKYEDLEVLDRDGLIEDGYLTPGDPDDSRILQVIEGDEMPKGGPPLSAAEKELLRRWISEGANFPTFAERKKLGLEHLLTTLKKRLDQEGDEATRRSLRFFTLLHVYNDPRVSDDDLRLYRAALSKAINSVSRAEEIILPAALDDEQTIYEVDLRKLKWPNPREAWLRIVDRYPYGLRLDGLSDRALADAARQVYAAAGSDLPYVHADWFVATALRPPLYHDLLGLPKTLDELLADLDVDDEQDFLDALAGKPNRLVRGGVIDSGVAEFNRVLDRHNLGAYDGVFWISHDFLGVEGRRNIMSSPFGPKLQSAAHPFPQLAYEHDGGELIASLPNGLHLYLLIDAEGNRLDAAPFGIAQDDVLKASGDATIVNGISCVACHRHGMISFQDQMRGGVALAGATRRALEHLVPPQNELERVLTEDQDRYLTALEKAIGVFFAPPGGRLEHQMPVVLLEKAIGVFFAPPGKELSLEEMRRLEEPVYFVARRYNQSLALTDAVVELGVVEQGAANLAIAEQTLREKIENIARLGQRGLVPLINGDRIKRADWESRDRAVSLYQLVARELRPGAVPVHLGVRPDAAGLRESIAALAAEISKVIREEEQREAAVGAISGPTRFPASVGSLLAKTLEEELDKLGVAVAKGAAARAAALEIKGDYGINDNGPDNPRLKLILRVFRTRTIDEVWSEQLEIEAPDEEFLTALVGPSTPASADQEDVLGGAEAPLVKVIDRHSVANSASAEHVVQILKKSGDRFIPCEVTVDKDGHARVRLKRGDVFRIRIINKSAGFDAAAAISIDGLSLFEFSEYKEYSRVILPRATRDAEGGVAPQPRDIRGWHVTNNVSDEFVVTDFAGALAVQLNRPPEQVGTITLQFAHAWRKGETPPPGERDPDTVTRGGDAGTGKGERIEARYTEEERFIGRNRSALTIRYEIDESPANLPPKT